MLLDRSMVAVYKGRCALDSSMRFIASISMASMDPSFFLRPQIGLVQCCLSYLVPLVM